MRLFDRANQHALSWVKDMAAALGTKDSRKALHALRAGLHALRDRLSVDEAAQLSAQLPLIVRGLFYEGWHPRGKPLRIRRRADFLALVREKYAPRTDAAADDIVTALFKVLDRHITGGELANVLLSLPGELIEVAEGRPQERDY
jgi:uncharacterized protein (DUF2267 family)